MLASILVPMKFQKGETILEEGKVCSALYFVDKGMVRQYYYKNKKDVTEHFSFEGRIVFCIESFLKQEPSRLIVEALENSVLYAIPHDALFGLMVRNQEMEMLYRKILEHVAISSQEHADSQRFENAAERYERLLREKPEIILRAPMVHIASFLQMTPETLSRVRGASAGTTKNNSPRDLTDPWWTRTNIRRVAEQINRDYEGKQPVFLAVLNGSFIFAADLLREINVPCEISFIKLASYEGTTTTGNIREIIGLNIDITGRPVIIVEDIVDTGLTMAHMLETLKPHNPESIEICTLLLKPSKLQVKLDIRYCCKQIPDDFVVGYGLDYDGFGRNTKDIYTLIQN